MSNLYMTVDTCSDIQNCYWKKRSYLPLTTEAFMTCLTELFCVACSLVKPHSCSIRSSFTWFKFPVFLKYKDRITFGLTFPSLLTLRVLVSKQTTSTCLGHLPVFDINVPGLLIPWNAPFAASDTSIAKSKWWLVQFLTSHIINFVWGGCVLPQTCRNVTPLQEPGCLAVPYLKKKYQTNLLMDGDAEGSGCSTPAALGTNVLGRLSFQPSFEVETILLKVTNDQLLIVGLGQLAFLMMLLDWNIPSSAAVWWLTGSCSFGELPVYLMLLSHKGKTIVTPF